MKKISIIGGAGIVGSKIAYTLLMKQLAHEIVIYDINHTKARGEVEDLRHCLPYINNAKATTGDLDSTKDSDMLIITVNTQEDLGLNRTNYLKANTKILKDLIPDLAKLSPNAIILCVTNPVDIITALAYERSGFPKERVLGTGTLIDSSRLKYALSRKYNIPPKEIEAYLLGEHGNSSFVAWSLTRVQGIPFEDYLKENNKSLTEEDKKEVEEYVHRRPDHILEEKGETDNAISMATAEIVDAMINDRGRVLPVSSYVEDYLGATGQFISLPVLLNQSGASELIKPSLTEKEQEQFKASLDVITKNTELMKKCLK